MELGKWVGLGVTIGGGREVLGGRGQGGSWWAGGGQQLSDAIVMHATTMQAYTIRGGSGRFK